MLRSYAQSREDVLVWEFFHRKQQGFFVEVGANEPEKLSQTRLLEEQGWKGLLIEPLPECCERLRQARPRSMVYQVACGAPDHKGRAQLRIGILPDRSALAECDNCDPSVHFAGVIEVEVCTLDELLSRQGNPLLDFISIDVEGAELDVLRGFDLGRHRPALLLVEDYVYSLKVHRHLTGNGYRLVRRTGSNNWYVPLGTPFSMTMGDRMELLRKMYPATPLRAFKRWLKRRPWGASALDHG